MQLDYDVAKTRRHAREIGVKRYVSGVKGRVAGKGSVTETAGCER